MDERPTDIGGEDPWRGYDAAALLAMSGDVSILLSMDSLILDVMVPEKEKFDVDLRTSWVGRTFAEIVAKDSIGKIAPLLNLNAGTSSRNDRWRHLNFVVGVAAEIPLLAKHFRVGTPYGKVRQVVCRDLRPMTELNARWQDENSRLLVEVARAKAAKSFAGDLVGSAPLADIMTAAVDEVAKICIEQALMLRDDDEVTAAQLLGITVAELRRRRRKPFH
ncbi:hypothetical protein QTO30_17285 [Yoonia sp. GPGPB17]|uniref:hypothetical protein n=1 Tax=Yoonia sp. GPGPB17 TaxID=3026147 RepID=UPI0030BE543F